MSLISTQKFVRRIAEKSGLPIERIDMLLKPDAEHQFDIKLANGNTHSAYRIQHSNRLGPYKGGIRFHPQVDLDEAKELALLMSLKTAALGLPLGGGKGGIAVDPKQLTDSDLEELARAYVAGLVAHLGPDRDVPAPDVNTDARIMDWMVDEYQNRTQDETGASFTGKSLGNGGSEGREAATGRGGVTALSEVLERLGKSGPLSIAVQGFGNVGLFFARIAQTEHRLWKLVAASDSTATITNPAGLDATALGDYKKQGASFDRAQKFGDILEPATIFEQPADVLVLAALGDAITLDNAKHIKAKIILELANGPIDEQAFRYLDSQGVIVIPDIIANGGGVIVSYLEWLQNKAEEHWSEARVNEDLNEYMVRAVDGIWSLSQEQDISLKEAAIITAVKRLAA